MRKISFLYSTLFALTAKTMSAFGQVGKFVFNYSGADIVSVRSPNDADVSVEIGFSDYASSLFYVGECGTDGYAALEAVVEYLIQNGIIDNYTADEELVSEYPNDYLEVNGYYFDNSNIVIHYLVGYHGGRRH